MSWKETIMVNGEEKSMYVEQGTFQRVWELIGLFSLLCISLSLLINAIVDWSRVDSMIKEIEIGITPFYTRVLDHIGI
jgi:hypothetical protein